MKRIDVATTKNVTSGRGILSKPMSAFEIRAAMGTTSADGCR